MPLTVILIHSFILPQNGSKKQSGFPSPTVYFIPDLKPFFLQILHTAAFLFLLQD